MEHITLPISLEDALIKLEQFYGRRLDDIADMSEREFLGSTHFFSGMHIRNSWKLWWSKDWNEPKPPLNEWFNSIGIVHADDMSGILLTCFYRKLKSIPYDIEKQVEKYHKHWKECGYVDGIPKE